LQVGPVEGKETAAFLETQNTEVSADMTWTTPVIIEVCIGMEVTSYLSAEI
jgi:coenzyme PQQ precursor peptide PqqA